jgi:hypothetical protein
MVRSAKSGQLQIRVSTQQKAAIREAARRAGMEMSSYVLARVLPAAARRFHDVVQACAVPGNERFALAELNSLLASLGAAALREATAEEPVRWPSPFVAAYAAAMVERASEARRMPPPPWTATIGALPEPYFASELPGLRLYLLMNSPAAFRRRNLFIDSSVGQQV